jgi:hypothetical protein
MCTHSIPLQNNEKLELSEEEEEEEGNISDRWKICNMHRPIPNSNGVLACATGDGLSVVGCFGAHMVYAPPHLHPTPTPYSNWTSII